MTQETAMKYDAKTYFYIHACFAVQATFNLEENCPSDMQTQPLLEFKQLIEE